MPPTTTSSFDYRHREGKVLGCYDVRKPDSLWQGPELLNEILADEAEAGHLRQLLLGSEVGRRMVYGWITDSGRVPYHSVCQSSVEKVTPHSVCQLSVEKVTPLNSHSTIISFHGQAGCTGCHNLETPGKRDPQLRNY